MVRENGILPVGAADLGWAVGCSCRGASHVRAGKPCQDAFGVWSGASGGYPCLIAAVADGHGDSQHDLSEVGSAIAARVAMNELLSPVPEDALYDSLPSMGEAFSATLPRRISDRWAEEVIADAATRFGGIPTGSNGQEMVVRRYGTTLLTARISSRLIMVGQIGDGDILLLRNGQRLEHLLDSPHDLVGTTTYSLSSRNAIPLWRTAVLPRGEGGLLLLATDGLSDSFGGSDHPQFTTFVRSLGERIAEFGIGRVAQSLPGWLSAYSQRGSGDDITLVLVMITPETEPMAEADQDATEEGSGYDPADRPEN